MGYYATGYGTITFLQKPTIDQLLEIETKIKDELTIERHNDNDTAFTIYSSYEKYHETEVIECLNYLISQNISGEIYYSSEEADDKHWRFTFSPQEGLTEEDAEIVYPDQVFLKDKIDTIPDTYSETPLTKSIQTLINSRQIAITEKGLENLIDLFENHNK